METTTKPTVLQDDLESSTVISQINDGNDATVTQFGNFTFGTPNSAIVNQDGGAISNVLQDGSNNTVTVDQ